MADTKNLELSTFGTGCSWCTKAVFKPIATAIESFINFMKQKIITGIIIKHSSEPYLPFRYKT